MTDVIVEHVDSYVYRWKKKELKYLLLKRKPGKYYGHLWQGVAGRMDNNETAVETLVRELKEETAMKPKQILVVERINVFYQSHKDRIKVVPVFGVEVTTKKVVLSDEHRGYRWVDIDTAVKLLSWEQQKKSISSLHQMLINNDDRIKWSVVQF